MTAPDIPEDPEEREACLIEVFPDSPEWLEVQGLVEERSGPHLEHYHFSLEIVRLWRVCPGHLQRAQRQAAEALGAPIQLFHGTSPANVKGILRSGFALPKRSGMFGRGIYFAECPLKSVQFAQASSLKSGWLQYAFGCLSGCAVGVSAGSAGCCCGAFCCGCLGSCAGCGLAHVSTKSTPKMLVCEVFLGKSRTLRGAKHINPSDDLKRGWLPRLFGAQDFNSVYVPGGMLGAVNVSEYVVYQPHQAVPKYVMEFKHSPT